LLSCELGFLSLLDLARLACVSRSTNAITKQAPRLLWDDAIRCDTSSAAFENLLRERAERLLVLRLHRCQDLPTEAFARLQACVGLRELVLTEAAALHDRQFARTIVSNLRWLTKLDLSNSAIGDESLLALAQACPDLTCLNVGGCVAITTVPGQFGKLERLDVSETRIGDEGMAELAQLLPTLRHLSISNTVVGDDGLTRVLSAHNQLRSLDIGYTDVTGEVVALIPSRCPCLESLNISGCNVTNDTLDRFARDATKLVSLCAMHLPHPLSTALVTIAGCCVNLQTLSLSNCDCLYEYALQMVRKLAFQLKHFLVSQCFWFDNHMLRALLPEPAQSRLEHLEILGTNVTDINLCTALVVSARSLNKIGMPHYVFSHANTLIRTATSRNICAYGEPDTHDVDNCSSCRSSVSWLSADHDEYYGEDAQVDYNDDDSSSSEGDASEAEDSSSWDNDREDAHEQQVFRGSSRMLLVARNVPPVTIAPFTLRQHRSVSIILHRGNGAVECGYDNVTAADDDIDGKKDNSNVHYSNGDDNAAGELNGTRSQRHSDEPLSPTLVTALVRNRLRRRSSAPACLEPLLHNLQAPPEMDKLQPWRRYWPAANDPECP
jgi:hypothetical protein